MVVFVALKLSLLRNANLLKDLLFACDESEFDTIQDHAGWVIKWAREMIKIGEDAIPAKEINELESSVVHGSKLEALNLISGLGQDVKQADGKA